MPSGFRSAERWGMKRWVVARKGADFDAIAQQYNISPFLARVIRNRDIVGDEQIHNFLCGEVDDMHNPALLKDIDKAAARIMAAIENRERIRVIGDYDVDGICASYILKKTISLLGGNVDVRLPDRIIDGYGLNMSLVDNAYEDGVSLIITCDNGIAARNEIEHANSLGINVVVTDHHEVPFELDGDEKKYKCPDAVAVVDPKQVDCNYPYEGICGAMVAYKLVVYIKQNPAYSEIVRSITDEVMDELLVFAAFATVEDVMTLLDENRIAVKKGLELIANCPNIGLRSLIEVSGLDRNSINVYNISFVLGPCINSSGRLDTAMRALELIECNNYENAVVIAQELKNLNDNRKNITQMYAEEAISLAGSDDYIDDKVLVIFLPECHESLAGIVAGRVREKYYKPTIILTRAAEGVKGSGRSIDDYNLFEELTKVSDIFTKFGGHKMAAGMNLPEDKVEELRSRLNGNTTLTDEQLIERCIIDIPLPVGLATLDFAKEIDKLEPFGVGNPRPLFAQKDVPISNVKIVGVNQNVLKLTLTGTDAQGRVVRRDGIMFGDVQDAYDYMANRDTLSILYQIGVNVYMGRENVQLLIKDYY